MLEIICQNLSLQKIPRTHLIVCVSVKFWKVLKLLFGNKLIREISICKASQ